MVCKKCHVHMEEDASVCPVCGAAVEPEEAATEQIAEEIEAVNEEAVAEVAVEETPAEEITETPAPAKKKTWVKITAIVACVALLLGLGATIWYSVNGGFAPKENDIHAKEQYYAEEADAVKAADTVIATVGDHKLTNEEFQLFYWMGVYDFYNQYGSYLSYFGLDVTKPFYEQYVEEGTTWEQYFVEAALNTWHNYQSILIYAEKEGYVVSDALMEQLDAVIDSMEVSAASYGFADASAMVQADMGPSSTIEAYKQYMQIYYGAMEYFESLYDSVNPTDAELEAFYEANAATIQSNYGVDKESGKLIDVRHILVCPEGGTTDENGNVTYSDEEWEACRQKAEDYLNQWKSGEATEESFGQLAMEVTEDPGSQSTGGLYTYVYEGQMVIPFNDWCFDESRQYGDTGLVKTTYGYHIMFFVYSEEGWSRYTREEMITEACSAIMEDAAEAYPMEVVYKKIVLGKADMAY